MSALDIMLESRKRMLRQFPYFGFRLHQLLLVPTTKTSTMATDGKAIYFNEKWVPEQYAIHGYKFRFCLHSTLPATPSWRRQATLSCLSLTA